MSSIIALRGPAGSSKSSIAYSFPGKRVVFDLELGFHRAYNYQSSTDTEIWQLPPIELTADAIMFSKGDRIKGRNKQLGQIVSRYVQALQDVAVKCIVFDTARELWIINHQAYLEEKQDAQEQKGEQVKQGWRQSLLPIEYASPNARMDNVIYLARQFKKTLILINHERDVYKSVIGPDGRSIEMPTGEKELDGWSKTLDKADWVLATRAEKQDIGVRFVTTIIKSPVGAELVGKEIPSLTYKLLAAMDKSL